MTQEVPVVQELFHLLMRELFDADFGMFSMDPVSRTYYFRAFGLDMGMEFELVGLLISLAIYNGHILEVSLPMAIYKCAPPIKITNQPSLRSSSQRVQMLPFLSVRFAWT